MLDGNSRLNLATFVTTWMEPEAKKLMEQTFDKNMIDKDEYPQTAEIEVRCVRMIADLWHAPFEKEKVVAGCSTTGSSEAGMLAGMAMKKSYCLCTLPSVATSYLGFLGIQLYCLLL